MTFTDKILLVLSPDYPSEKGEFNGSNAVKDQLAFSRKKFKKVIVIAPVLKTFGYTPQDKFCHDYSYDNVEVYFPRCMFFPRIIKVPFISNYTKVDLDTRLSATLQTILNHNLKFDIIHAHFTYPSAYIAAELKQRYLVPVVSTIHEDSGWFEEERNMNHPKFLKAWHTADFLTRVNTTEMALLRQYNLHNVHIPGGYNTTFFKPLDKNECRAKLNLKPTDKVLFTFGYLDERKGFQDLIVAIAHLPAQYFDVKCFISGDGAYKHELEEKVRQFALENRVFIIKRLDYEQVATYINAADLFILPSLRESFGSTQIEALGCGVPVIASDNLGSIDVIDDTCGYLFRTGDSLNLSSMIIKGLTTLWDRQKIAEYALKNYSWEVVSKQHDELYARLLEMKS
jgi:glycosyltransferase involved in cell wall biosynthesis